MSDDPKPPERGPSKPTVPTVPTVPVRHEDVLDAHVDGTPHITKETGPEHVVARDKNGDPLISVRLARLRHYDDGCPDARRARALAGGPAQVASDAYRVGYAMIDWHPATRRGQA